MKKLFKNPRNRKMFFLFLGDILGIAASLLFTIFLCSLLKDNTDIILLKRPLKLYALFLAAAIYPFILYIFELYAEEKGKDAVQVLTQLVTTSGVSSAFMFGCAKVLHINQTTMAAIFCFYALSLAVLYYWRQLFSVCTRRFQHFKQNILFIGYDWLTEDIIVNVNDPAYGVVGILTNDPSKKPFRIPDALFLGGYEKLTECVRENKVDVLVIFAEEALPLAVIKNIHRFRFEGIEVYSSGIFYEIITRKVAIKKYLAQEYMPYFDVDTFVSPIFKNSKRILDVCVSSLLFLGLLPVFLLISFLIWCTGGRPIFYVQERVGFQEKPFSLIKFRTMKKNAEVQNGPQWAAKDDTRVTSVGRILRRFRLDELPQLINVIRGDMSFTGPRPIRRHFADLIEEKVPFYSLRFSVKPGLTGWAQVCFEYGGSIEGHIEKFQYDLYYIKHASLFYDLFIVLKTFQTLVRRPGH